MKSSLIAAVLGTTLASLGCGNSSGECVPGESVTCACVNGEAGAQVCLTTKTYGPCTCAPPISIPGGTDGGVSDAGLGDQTDYVSLILNGSNGTATTTYWHTDCFGSEQGFALATGGTGRFQDPYPIAPVQSVSWTQLSGDDLLLSASGTPYTAYSFNSIRGAIAEARFTANVAVNSGTGQDCTFDLRLGSLQSNLSLVATWDSLPMCPLGWTSGGSADGGVADTGGHRLNLTAGCAGAGFALQFSPLPLPGGSAPCTNISFTTPQFIGGCTVPPTGSATVNGATGGFTMSGSCSCSTLGGTHTGNVTFTGVPITVQ